jgi:hypothetical protein
MRSRKSLKSFVQSLICLKPIPDWDRNRRERVGLVLLLVVYSDCLPTYSYRRVPGDVRVYFGCFSCFQPLSLHRLTPLAAASVISRNEKYSMPPPARPSQSSRTWKILLGCLSPACGSTLMV